MGLKIVSEKIITTEAQVDSEKVLDSTHVLGWVAQINSTAGVNGVVTIEGSVDGKTFEVVETQTIGADTTEFAAASGEFYYPFMKVKYADTSSSGGEVEIFLGTKGI